MAPGWMSAAAVFLALCGASGGQAQTVFEKKIIEMNPCSALRKDKGLVEIHIDRIDMVRIDEVSLILRDEEIAAGVKGALSCKTSDAALFPGSVGADIAISARLGVQDCAVAEVSAQLSNISGGYGPVLEAFRGEAEKAVAGAVSEELVKACKGLLDSLNQ